MKGGMFKLIRGVAVALIETRRKTITEWGQAMRKAKEGRACTMVCCGDVEIEPEVYIEPDGSYQVYAIWVCPVCDKEAMQYVGEIEPGLADGTEEAEEDERFMADLVNEVMKEAGVTEKEAREIIQQQKEQLWNRTVNNEEKGGENNG
jgi:hypothetical protein